MNGKIKHSFKDNYESDSKDRDMVPISYIVLELSPEYHMKDFLNKFTEVLLDFNN